MTKREIAFLRGREELFVRYLNYCLKQAGPQMGHFFFVNPNRVWLTTVQHMARIQQVTLPVRHI